MLAKIFSSEAARKISYTSDDGRLYSMSDILKSKFEEELVSINNFASWLARSQKTISEIQ